MNRIASLVGILVLAFGSLLFAQGRGRPAPPPSRYGYSLKIDADSLPKGVALRDAGDGQTSRLFIANSSDVPLVIHEIFQDGKLVAGTKLVSGKVYQYFPNGVPMEGKTHLKGWQAPFGEIKETIFYLAKEPDKIYEGRKPNLPENIPPAEAVSIPVKYGEKPYELKGVIEYHLNKAYDDFYRAQSEKVE